jgi:hypothetical protein
MRRFTVSLAMCDTPRAPCAPAPPSAYYPASWRLVQDHRATRLEQSLASAFQRKPSLFPHFATRNMFDGRATIPALKHHFPPHRREPNYVTELHLEKPSQKRRQFVLEKRRMELRRQVVLGKDAQEQRPRFVPDKERQGRLATKVQPRTRHNENLLIPQRRAARPRQRVLPRGQGRQVRSSRGALRTRARRDRRFHPRSALERFLLNPPCSAASFEVNSEPRTGARPSVRLCLGPIIDASLV